MGDTKLYTPRGKRSNIYMSSLKEQYDAIIKYVNTPDSELDIQYRGNYVNIYYLGGSLLKLSGRESIEFNKNYFHLPKKGDLRMTDIERLVHENYKAKILKSSILGKLPMDIIEQYRKDALEKVSSLEKTRDEKINRLKSAAREVIPCILEEFKSDMRKWKDNLQEVGISKSSVNERVVQHYISLFNKEANDDSDFIVIDLEYALSEKSDYCIPPNQKKPNAKQPRIDIIAIEKSSGQLYVMELKYGLDSTEGKAGVKEHFEDFEKSVGHEDRWNHFWNDINDLYLSQINDGLFSGNIKLKKAKPIFAFVLKPKNLDEVDAFKEILNKEGLDFVQTLFLPVESANDKPQSDSFQLNQQ